jgi:general stress protein 26
MPPAPPPSNQIPQAADEASLQARILSVLDSRHLMALATNRPDGWPQVTLVNYFRREHALYFVVATDSQKFANITRDPRVSIAIGGGAAGPYSLSMSAHATEVRDFELIERLNKTIQALPPESGFTPHPGASSIVLLEAQPQIITLVDYSTPPGHRELLEVVEHWQIQRTERTDTQ